MHILAKADRFFMKWDFHSDEFGVWIVPVPPWPHGSAMDNSDGFNNAGCWIYVGMSPVIA